MFSRSQCFPLMCFLNQREGFSSPEAALKERAANQAANIKIQDANDTRNTPGAPPIVTSVSPSPYATTINTSTIAKNTADINTLFGAASSFSSLVNKVNALSGEVSAHEKIAHINRPDYELLGCRATTALIKFDEQIAKEKAQSGSSGW